MRLWRTALRRDRQLNEPPHPEGRGVLYALHHLRGSANLRFATLRFDCKEIMYL
ncbi:MAG: hypothetical protein LBK73_03300 [Treponema sp.]|nr:hypothetical protein [Treponema sp.]